MKIFYFFSEEVKKISVPAKFKEIVKEIERNEEKKIGEICFIFVSRKDILGINRVYLKHDYITDVITFERTKKNYRSGDIYICTDHIADNALMMKLEFRNELLRVMIHGILHLMGYKDNSAKQKEVIHHKEDYYMGRQNEMMK